MSVEFKALSRDLYTLWICYREGISVPSFIIVGYMWQVLMRRDLFNPSPHLWAAPKRPILNRVNINHRCLRKLAIKKIMYKRDCCKVYCFSCSFLTWNTFMLRCKQLILLEKRFLNSPIFLNYLFRLTAFTLIMWFLMIDNK